MRRDLDRRAVRTAVNADGVKSRGAEINLFGKVTHDLSVSTGFIYAKATYPDGYTSSTSTGTFALGGSQPFLAALQIHLLGRLPHPINDALSVLSALMRCGSRAWPINRPRCCPIASSRTGRWVVALA
jgi:outer membrane receptor protein involved in Fe transport